MVGTHSGSDVRKGDIMAVMTPTDTASDWFRETSESHSCSAVKGRAAAKEGNPVRSRSITGSSTAGNPRRSPSTARKTGSSRQDTDSSIRASSSLETNTEMRDTGSASSCFHAPV
ncbi:hypothetical protein D3C71_1663850 [compost metagenome]